MHFKKIIQNYTEYIKLDYFKKLHAGELLAESARMLLELDSENLDRESKIQRHYLMQRIADDLLMQARDMGHTKQYDCVPALKEYTYLAFDLVYDYCGFKPARRLLPFLTQVIYYEKQNPNSERLEELESIYKQSLAFEKSLSRE